MAKVNLYPDFKDFLKLLNSNEVRYLLLGGYAVIYYGYRRMTDDLDVWIAIDPANREQVSATLQAFGFSANSVRPGLFDQIGKVFKFGREPVRIDLLTGPSGVEFETCYHRRNVVALDGVQVPLISLADLKANKLSSGRSKDLADLDNLPPGEAATKKLATEKRRSRRK